MNLKIPATMKIALVGHSGCGKSTMANLLLRLYDLTGGKLLIDGVDIREYNVRELRKQIGIVMQEPLLFNTTIKENILYGNDQADDAKVRQVAQMANALQFIESNIEDLDKEDVQKEIVKRLTEKINAEKDKYSSFSRILSLYDEKGGSQGTGLTFDQMHLIEDLLMQADDKLKTAINSNIDLFIEVVKQKSSVKGSRWDDIVMRFEYLAVELPSLKKHLSVTNLAQSHIDAVV